jgi:alkylation response protein AidB-like acyl-CoA dehydrogenase
VQELTAAGCFRTLVPRSHGGAELDLPAELRVIEELARADGSVGWTVMIGRSTPVVLGRLPRPTFDAIYAEGPDVIVGGTINPTGVATPVDGGFRVTGKWSFASGCQHAHWFIAHCVVDDGRQPPIRMMVLPAADVKIKDTWSVAGLCGTGSHDFVVTDGFVPTERSFVVWGEPCLDVPLLWIPEPSLATLSIAAVAVGIAHGALGEVTDLATGRCRCSAAGRWPRTRCSSISWAKPTRDCEAPAPCCTPTPTPRGRRRRPVRRSLPATVLGSGPRPRG